MTHHPVLRLLEHDVPYPLRCMAPLRKVLLEPCPRDPCRHKAKEWKKLYPVPSRHKRIACFEVLLHHGDAFIVLL